MKVNVIFFVIFGSENNFLIWQLFWGKNYDIFLVIGFFFEIISALTIIFTAKLYFHSKNLIHFSTPTLTKTSTAAKSTENFSPCSPLKTNVLWKP